MKKCKFCKRSFKPVNENQKFCKYACKMASYWSKKSKEAK